MKRLYRLAVPAVALVLLAGCAETPVSTTTTTTTVATTTTDAGPEKHIVVYYDGFYGPVTHGNWSADGTFYYQDASGAFQKDYEHHFNHNPDIGLVRTDIIRSR